MAFVGVNSALSRTISAVIGSVVGALIAGAGYGFLWWWAFRGSHVSGGWIAFEDPKGYIPAVSGAILGGLTGLLVGGLIGAVRPPKLHGSLIGGALCAVLPMVLLGGGPSEEMSAGILLVMLGQTLIGGVCGFLISWLSAVFSPASRNTSSRGN